MVLARSVAGVFKWCQFESELILLAIGWYLRFSLSYRDFEELLADLGLYADHVTVWRWVQRTPRNGPTLTDMLFNRYCPIFRGVDSFRFPEPMKSTARIPAASLLTPKEKFQNRRM
jgi:hypothetical protein